MENGGKVRILVCPKSKALAFQTHVATMAQTWTFILSKVHILHGWYEAYGLHAWKQTAFAPL